MARHLLVAHQTAESEELLASARLLAEEDPAAEFVLLVPATPVEGLLVWEEGETADVARRRGESAQAWLRERDLNVVEVRTGDQDPLSAISDEMQAGHRYSSIVVSTLPAGMSRWLKMDVISRVRRNFPGHRVMHVVCRAPAPARAQS
jgi:hypothetical protein